MLIRGQNIILRAIEKSDLPQLLEWSNDPEIAVHLGEIHFPTSQSQEERWFERIDSDQNNIRLAVLDGGSRLIGYSGYWNINWRARHAEHAVVIGEREKHRFGYGSDVIRASARHAFEHLDLYRLYCHILSTNTASIACYQRCGFQIEGTLRQHQYRSFQRVDQLVLGLLADEFQAD